MASAVWSVSRLLALFLVAFAAGELDIDKEHWYGERVSRDGDGWLRVDESPFALSGCDITTKNASELTAPTFLQMYFNDQPILITNAVDYSGFKALVANWSVDSLIESHGEKFVGMVHANPVKFAEFTDIRLKDYLQFLRNWSDKAKGPSVACSELETAYGKVASQLCLEAFSRKEPLYVFDRRFPFSSTRPPAHDSVDDSFENEEKLLLNYYTYVPPYFKNFAIGRRYFAVGGPGTGTYFHSHGPTMHALFKGRKRWFFFTPSQLTRRKVQSLMVSDHFEKGAYKHPRHFLDNEMNDLPSALKPIQCVQPANSILLFPNGWGHATLNLDETAAIAFELDPPLTEAQVYERTEESKVSPHPDLEKETGGSPSDLLWKMAPSAVVKQMNKGVDDGSSPMNSDTEAANNEHADRYGRLVERYHGDMTLVETALHWQTDERKDDDGDALHIIRHAEVEEKPSSKPKAASSSTASKEKQKKKTEKQRSAELDRAIYGSDNHNDNDDDGDMATTTTTTTAATAANAARSSHDEL